MNRERDVGERRDERGDVVEERVDGGVESVLNPCHRLRTRFMQVPALDHVKKGSDTSQITHEKEKGNCQDTISVGQS